MNIPSFSGKHITLIGLGILGGGVGTARFFASRGARVHITDLRSESELAQSIAQLSEFDTITYSYGSHNESDIEHADLIVKNPGVPTTAPILQLAQDKNIPVHIAEDLFLEWFDTKRVIGITGTRGKSTTTMMIYEVLKQAEQPVLLGGNMKGTSTLSLLDTASDDAWAILELSSWQLSGLTKSPHIAVMTNIYPDHLNRYNSMDDYIDDKLNIARFQNAHDICIVHKNTPELVKQTKSYSGKKILFDATDWPDTVPLALAGIHNRSNAAAALKAAQAMGVSTHTAIEAIATYKGLPGRLQEIGKINGVTFINDTTSTTPIATITALEAYPEKTCIVIMGGNSKELETDDLVKQVAQKAKEVVLIYGNATEQLKQDLEKIDNVLVSRIYESMDKAVEYAFTKASSQDIVLLSPGFTSFGVYSNEFDRGRAFDHAVEKIKNKKKTPR